MWWEVEGTRQTIETARLVSQSWSYVLSNVEFTPAPLRNGAILLRKRMPRHAAVESGGTTRRQEDALAEFE
jgi:hypothetical protein